MRVETAGQGDGLFALRGGPGNLVAEPPQLAGQVRGDDRFVFDDENGGLAHDFPSSMVFGPPNVTVNSVP